MRFIHNVDEFLNFKVNDQEENKEYHGEDDQFNNLVPRGLVALENIFDRQDRKKSNVEQMKLGDYIEINIGTETEPKLIKIGKGTSKKKGTTL